jgi:hypothetical protein
MHAGLICRPVRIVVLASICALGIYACGGGTGKSGGSGTTAGDSLALELAKCMRAHGVPNFPDPGAPAGNSVDTSSPAAQSAGATCDRLEPNNPQPSRKPSEARIRAAFAAARCVRSHGVSGFPDPTLTPPSVADVIDDAGVFFVLPSGVAMDSPAVKRATHACSLGPP